MFGCLFSNQKRYGEVNCTSNVLEYILLGVPGHKFLSTYFDKQMCECNQTVTLETVNKASWIDVCISCNVCRMHTSHESQSRFTQATLSHCVYFQYSLHYN